MAQVKFRFELNDKPNKDGLQEVFLIAFDGKRKKIKTDVSVKNEHFGVFKDVLTAKGKKVHKRVLTPLKWITTKDRDAEYKNSQLKKKLDEYEKALTATEEKDQYVTKESVVRAVENKYVLKDVVGVFDRLLKELEDDYPNWKGYVTAKNHFTSFLGKRIQDVNC
jgi:hypothetical protein